MTAPALTFFSADDWRCKHCGENHTDPKHMARIDELRRRVGFPIVLSSGYRCPVHNQAVSSTGPNGPHTRGASDLLVDRLKAYIVLRVAFEMGFTGIGVKGHGPSRFVHLDDLPNDEGQPRPTVWSYP